MTITADESKGSDSVENNRSEICRLVELSQYEPSTVAQRALESANLEFTYAPTCYPALYTVPEQG